MNPADRSWFVIESAQALFEAGKEQCPEVKRKMIETGGNFLRAGMQEIWDLNDLMEGMGASVMAREKSIQMLIAGEI